MDEEESFSKYSFKQFSLVFPFGFFFLYLFLCMKTSVSKVQQYFQRGVTLTSEAPTTLRSTQIVTVAATLLRQIRLQKVKMTTASCKYEKSTLIFPIISKGGVMIIRLCFSSQLFSHQLNQTINGLAVLSFPYSYQNFCCYLQLMLFACGFSMLSIYQ